MPNKKKFRKQFWENKRMVGAISPSSRFLAHKMIKQIDFNNAKVLVELGAGTGVFTREIIRKMQPDCTLLVFELNDEFCNSLQRKLKDDRVHIIHDSAEHIGDYLKKYNLGKADVVLSSLPLTVFKEELRKSVLNASYQSLKDLGKYIQFQYSLQAKRTLKMLYKDVDIQFTAINFPPAFIYTCKKG